MPLYSTSIFVTTRPAGLLYSSSFERTRLLGADDTRLHHTARQSLLLARLYSRETTDFMFAESLPPHLNALSSVGFISPRFAEEGQISSACLFRRPL